MSIVKDISQFLDDLEAIRFNPNNLSASEIVEKTNKVQKVVAQYMRAPAKKGREIAHNFITASDIPQMITGNASTFMNVENYDMSWELAFMDVPIEAGRNFWEILTLTNGVTFRKVPEGARVRVEGLTGEKAIAYVDKYGGAIGWTDEEIRFRQYASMQAKAQAFRDAFWKNKADVHYTLFGASISGSNTTSYQQGSADTVLDGDVKTINAAAFALADRMKDKYVGDVLAQPMILYFNPVVWDRVLRALRQTSQDYAGSVNRVLYNIRPVPTFNRYLSSATGESTTTTFALVLPGYQMQKATVMDPTPYYGFDETSLTYVQSMWSYYGAVASANQIQFGELA